MRSNLFEELKFLLWEYRREFLKGFLMVLVSNALLIANPLIFRQALIAVDPSTGSGNEQVFYPFRYLFGSYVTTIPPWVVLLLIITSISAYFKYSMRIQFIAISRDVERQVRSKVFSRIQQQSMAFFDKHGIGELMSRLSNDISTYRDVLGPGVMYPLFFTSLVIPGLIGLFVLSPSLASIALLPLFAIPILNHYIRPYLYRVSMEVQKTLADLSNMTQEQYAGIRLIKGYGIEGIACRLFDQLCQNLLGSRYWFIILSGVIFPFFSLLTKFATLALVLGAGGMILKAWGELSVADFVSFMWIQSYIFFPVLMMAWVLPIYQRGRAAFERIREIYVEPIEVQDQGSTTAELADNPAIVINHLSFQYPGTSRSVLSDVSIHIPGGSFVGITGPVGAGKSTLFHLLNREYEVPYGVIMIGGRDIHDYSLDHFRRKIITVEQVPFLFSKSVAENVSFGLDSATQQEIEMVSEFADLHQTILSFPEQYETIIGERGMTLSGGQKQRVAMARAFLVNRSILFLDDIFSAVDSATELKIFQAMKKNFKGKTVLLVTHRVSVLEQMDRVIYLSKGSVAEDGSPEQLRAQNGLYAALWELQRTQPG